MLIVGPDGGLVDVPPFQAAAVNLFQSLGAKQFHVRPAQGWPPGCSVAFAGFEQWFDGAFGRSPDEAVLRLIELVVNNKVDCLNCARPLWVDPEVMRPLEPWSDETESGRDYLNTTIEKTMKTCTLYFDTRDTKWKQSCKPFEADLEPTEEPTPWNAAPAAGLIVPSGQPNDTQFKGN